MKLFNVVVYLRSTKILEFAVVGEGLEEVGAKLCDGSVIDAGGCLRMFNREHVESITVYEVQ